MAEPSNPIQIVTFGGHGEKERRREFVELIRACPVPDDELLLNMGLFLTPQTLGRVLFMDFLYRQVLNIQGVIMEFGCRWGQNVSLFTALRGIYEPYNRLRKVIGFDTFEGLTPVAVQDGASLNQGMYAVSAGYETYLERLLGYQEQESALPHLKKYEIVRGDASLKIDDYLAANPETVVALAYFDMDIYQPTRDCLEKIKDRLTVGSVLGFDEANDHLCPGETLAIKEVLGLNRFALKRFSFGRASYMVIDHPI